jgi:predicted nucleic-acid-binding protein
MIAVDTNILARYLLTDDRKQAELATTLLEGRAQFTAPSTVILELVWVLESCDCTRADVAGELRFAVRAAELQTQGVGSPMVRARVL